MNKKEIAKMADLLTAASKGRTIQSRFLDGSSDWVTEVDLSYIDFNQKEYRVKPLKCTVCLDIEDMDYRVINGKTMWVREKAGSKRAQIIRFTSINVSVIEGSNVIPFTYEALKNNWAFMDGSPCEKEGEI